MCSHMPSSCTLNSDNPNESPCLLHSKLRNCVSHDSLLLFYCRHSRNTLLICLMKPYVVCYGEKQKKQLCKQNFLTLYYDSIFVLCPLVWEKLQLLQSATEGCSTTVHQNLKNIHDNWMCCMVFLHFWQNSGGLTWRLSGSNTCDHSAGMCFLTPPRRHDWTYILLLIC